MFATFLHKYLRVPFSLHVHFVRKAAKPRATVLFLHGIGSAGSTWDSVLEGLPKDINVVAVDLLGFGESPKPRWAAYDAKTQARSVAATLIKLNIRQRPIIVGHSMGALVAVELAKRYPLAVKSLILCSPPFYKDNEQRLLPTREWTLKRLFRLARHHPEKFTVIAALAVKYKLVEAAFNVTHENIDTYMAALEASIINQTSLEDAKQVRRPMRMLHGALDPVVIKKNLDIVVAANKYASLHLVYLAGHTVMGPYATAVVKEIMHALPPTKRGILSKSTDKKRTPNEQKLHY